MDGKCLEYQAPILLIIFIIIHRFPILLLLNPFRSATFHLLLRFCTTVTICISLFCQIIKELTKLFHSLWNTDVNNSFLNIIISEEQTDRCACACNIHTFVVLQIIYKEQFRYKLITGIIIYDFFQDIFLSVRTSQ